MNFAEANKTLNALPVEKATDWLPSHGFDLGRCQGDLIDDSLAAHRAVAGVAVQMDFNYGESVGGVAAYIHSDQPGNVSR